MWKVSFIIFFVGFHKLQQNFVRQILTCVGVDCYAIARVVSLFHNSYHKDQPKNKSTWNTLHGHGIYMVKHIDISIMLRESFFSAGQNYAIHKGIQSTLSENEQFC